MENTSAIERKHHQKKHSGRALLLLSLLLAMLICLSLFWGRFSISPSEMLLWLSGSLSEERRATVSLILLSIRLPRILAAVLVGTALAVAGSSYQGVFRNPMVSPDILGASGGAGFGASLCIILGAPLYMLQASAFVCGLIAVGVSCLLSSLASSRGSKTLVMILSGMVVSAMFNALISIIKYTADPYSQLPEITFWLMGSLSSVKGSELLASVIPSALSLLVLMLIRWRINVLSLSEEEAIALGVNPNLIRGIVICCSTMLTASAISLCGQVGWVGLVVPHIARMITGANYRKLLPATAIIGAIFLLAVDNIARSLLAVEVPLGILTAIIGSPIFVYLLLRGKRGWL